VRRSGHSVFLTSFLILLAGLWSKGEQQDSGRLEVFVGNPPQAYIVERVGGSLVNVHVLVELGDNPHTFEPTPKQMMALGRAAVYFKTGMPFEDRLAEKVLDSGLLMKVRDLARGVQKRRMATHRRLDRFEHDEVDNHESHVKEGQHADVFDPHIWLSPPLIRIQAKNVAEVLEEVDPGSAEAYRRNLDEFLDDIDRTHAWLKEVLAPYRGRSFYVFHPAFGYFGDAYGLVQEAVEIGGKSPTPKQLRDLIRMAKAEGVEIIFVQPQFDKKSAESVAHAIGGAVVPIDSLARDVLANLKDIAVKLQRALKQ